MFRSGLVKDVASVAVVASGAEATGLASVPPEAWGVIAAAVVVLRMGVELVGKYLAHKYGWGKKDEGDK